MSSSAVPVRDQLEDHVTTVATPSCRCSSLHLRSTWMSTMILTRMSSRKTGRTRECGCPETAVIKSTEELIWPDHRGTGYRNPADRSAVYLRFIHAPRNNR